MVIQYEQLLLVFCCLQNVRHPLSSIMKMHILQGLGSVKVGNACEFVVQKTSFFFIVCSEARAPLLTCCYAICSICGSEDNCKESSVMAKEDQTQDQESSQLSACNFFFYLHDVRVHTPVSLA